MRAIATVAGGGLAILGTALVIYLVLLIDRATSPVRTATNALNFERNRRRRASRQTA